MVWVRIPPCRYLRAPNPILIIKATCLKLTFVFGLQAVDSVTVVEPAVADSEFMSPAPQQAYLTANFQGLLFRVQGTGSL